MKSRKTLFRSRAGLAALLAAGALLLGLPARGQLAITEMMSSALKTNGTIILTNNSDFWELTNFGTNTVSLLGYHFADKKESLRSLPAASIGAGESIVFVRNNLTSTPQEFRTWWGSCVGSNVQIRFYSKPGFSANGDGIRVYDLYNNLVDSVDFGPATRGVSFVYDTNTGVFATLSVLGEGPTCEAQTAADIGSPGATTGPVPLRIVEQPASMEGCLGAIATFRISAVGMPRPHYQWLFNNTRIPFANGPSLTVSPVTPADAGIYSVVITNGLTIVQSSNALLVVNTNPTPPSFAVPPADTTVVTNRIARFSTSVCASPAATYQWFSNGMAIAGATDRTLLVFNCTLGMSGTEYCVRASNSEGTNTACARLYVTTRPDLRITEVQAYPITGCDDHHDWFEVTNFGTNAVDLLGYHFSDEPVLPGSVTVTQSMVVQPRESAIFVKSRSANVFVEWWGADLLPPGLKIFTYDGFSLFRGGDTIYLWNAEAEQPDEYIDGIAYATNFPGVSQWFDSDLAPFGMDSVVGEFGGFRACLCGDVGSPGYITNPPPRVISIQREALGASVKWRAIEGATYELEYCPTLGGETSVSPGKTWISLGSVMATNSLPVIVDPTATDAGQRFYRIRQITP